MWKAALLGAVAAVLGLVVKKGEPEQALLLGLAAAAMILAAALGAMASSLDFFTTLTRQAGVGAALTVPVAKSVGIAITGRIAADLCRDAGQSAAASALELAAAAAVVCTVIPLLRALTGLVFRLA